MILNFRKPLLAAAILTLALVSVALVGCNDDNKGPNYPDTFAFKQELRVEQWNDGTTNAFANFIALNQAGIEISVELPSKASIECNGQKMLFEEPTAADQKDDYFYAYSVQLHGTPSEAIFTFNRTATLKIVNSISLTNVPMIRLQPGSTIENDVNYTYTSSIPDATAADIRIFMIRTDGTNAGSIYRATLFGNQYYFSGVPQGKYVLRSMATFTINYLQQQNGGAGGSISAAKVYEIKGVTVK